MIQAYCLLLVGYVFRDNKCSSVDLSNRVQVAFCGTGLICLSLAFMIVRFILRSLCSVGRFFGVITKYVCEELSTLEESAAFLLQFMDGSLELEII